MCCSSFASTKIYDEDFDDQDADALNGGGLTASVVITNDSAHPSAADSEDYSWETGRGESGYCLSDNGSTPAGATTFLYFYGFGGSFPASNQIYISFWQRFSAYTPDPDPGNNENIKTFYMRWCSTLAYVHYSIYTSPSTMFYSAKNCSGSVITVGTNYPGTGGVNLADGNWHHIEFFVDFDEAISKYWVDDTLLVDDDYSNSVWSSFSNLSWIEIPSIDGEEANVFTRQFDDIEIWDGMPTGGDTTPPVVTGYDPAKSETGVAKDTNIEFIVYDAANDVDLDTIVMTEESNYHCCSGMTGTCPGSGTKDLTCTDYSVLGDGYTVVYNPGVDYSYEQVVNVTIDADDTEANSMTQDVYSFTIESEPQTALTILKGSGNAWRFNGKKWTLE